MIWIVAGTKSARELSDFLLERGVRIVATTTTDYGKNLLGEHENLTVLQGKLQKDDMLNVISEYSVKAVIDSSHPYAVEVKENLIAATGEVSIPSIRFERETIEIEKAEKFKTYEDASKYIKSLNGNILMTIGSQKLNYFRENDGQKIYARVLPLESSLHQCAEAGYSPDRIIAMKSIFSMEFNMSLMKELDIRYMVTKESGSEGGVPEKIGAAKELGIEIIVIERPDYSYSETCYTVEEIFERIRNL